MPQDTPTARRLNANQTVAHNLARARALRGVTQEQASALLEPFLGERWSQAVFSAAERSVGGKRVREFDANVVHAMSRAFELPIAWFFLPPDADTAVGIDDAPFPPAAPVEQVALATWTSDEVRARVDELTRQLPPEERARLLRGVIDGDPGGVRETAVLEAAVAQVRPQLAALVNELQAQIDVLDALAGGEGPREDRSLNEGADSADSNDMVIERIPLAPDNEPQPQPTLAEALDAAMSEAGRKAEAR